MRSHDDGKKGTMLKDSPTLMVSSMMSMVSVKPCNSFVIFGVNGVQRTWWWSSVNGSTTDAIDVVAMKNFRDLNQN